jgi:hypothetical protein
MLNIEIKDRTNIVIVTPDGAITAADIDRMAEEINNYINNQDRVPNLVFHTKSIPFGS